MPFQKSGLVLQDLVNELGRRLDFEVENGLYQGRRNAIGFDGLWKAPGEAEIVVEVKTTDAYTFALETTNDYREALIADRQVSRSASILIVVGREDTGALEAQVRGSRYAGDIRLISIESFIKLVQRPFEYTKVDRIIEILFATAKDVDSQQEEEQLEYVNPGKGIAEVRSQAQEKTAQGLIEEMRDRAGRGFAKVKGVELVKRGRSYYWNSDKNLRVCCTVSKRYETDYQPYWYAYHPKWDEFLQQGDGYVLFACMDLESAFAVPHRWFAENTGYLNAAERDGVRQYLHIVFTGNDGGLAINLTKIGRKHSLEPYRFPLAARAT